MKEKNKYFKIIWFYLKDDKLKVFIYILLVLSTYFPALLSAFFWGKALEALIIKDITTFLLYLLSWEAIFIICYSILLVPREKLYNYLEIKFMNQVSRDLYKKIDCLPAIAFEDIGVGEFINRLYTDTDRIMELLNKLIRLVCKSFVVVIVVVLTFYISVLLGIEVVIFALIMGFISYKFLPKIKKTQEKIKKESDNYIKVATENITGIREIKALGIRKNIENNIFKDLSSLFTHEKTIRGYQIWYNAINNIIYFILQFIILYSGGYFFIHGKIVYGLFMVLESYIWRIDEVVESISDFGVNYNKVIVSLKRIDEILNNKLYKDEEYGKIDLKGIKGSIEFKDVSFHYREDEDNTLNNLNLKIEPNKKVAVVGRSGNGKSTLFNLLLRYFDSTEGTILIDGIDIKELSEDSLRNSISIIRQSPFLFNISMLDNFKYVKRNVTLKEVREVCKRAYIDDYIMSLPNGYNTIIGEGGINLSGGQKQRIAIARTLLRDTKIILFDEATSALDNESQEFIKKTIDELVKDHTVIIVAHRLSTIIDADEIHVIDKGSLAASGKHKELLKTCNVYKSLYTQDSSN